MIDIKMDKSDKGGSNGEDTKVEPERELSDLSLIKLKKGLWPYTNKESPLPIGG